jgi:hypothetical protein
VALPGNASDGLSPLSGFVQANKCRSELT